MDVKFRMKDLIDKNLPVGDENTIISEVMRQMIRTKHNFFIILSKEKKILGVVTLYDVLNKIIPYFVKVDHLLGFISTNILLDKDKIKKILQQKVNSIMTKKVYSLNNDDDMMKAVILMYMKNFDYIPVIDRKSNKYLGSVSRTAIEKKLLEIINKSNK